MARKHLAVDTILTVLKETPSRLESLTAGLAGLYAGRPFQQTLLSHADGLARHERTHLKQIARIISALQ